MNILIVGGTGVLSSAVTAEALHQSIKVTMVNRGNRTIPQGVEHIKADKNDLNYISQKLINRKFDAIIDFLCYTDEQTEKSVHFYTQYTKQYIYISSCAVYDTEFLHGQLADEESKKELAIWKYSIDKWASEQKLMQLFKGKQAHYTVIRPCVTYGDTRIPYGISPRYGYHWTLCARILSGKPIIRWNGGINRCNITRVEDFAVGVIGLIGNPKAYNEAFNICGDETPSFNEVLEGISKALEHPITIVDLPSEFYANEIPSRAGELLGGRSIDAINSNIKIKSIVPSFRQNISLNKGIRMTIDSYKSQNYQLGIDWKFDADTDRIIKKWCKINEIDSRSYNLKFMDYLGNASMVDKIVYWKEFYKENKFILYILRVLNLLHRITFRWLRY